ncbi:MAG: sulfatase family protein [Planctomycetota bacterium]|jgi:choline-sulfatase
MSASKRSNILFLLTDQQSASMMSCAGNAYLETPAMDALAAAGTRFDRAYCTNPVCLPSRMSLMSGEMPSALNIRHNGTAEATPVSESMQAASLGRVMKAAGYTVAYGGKRHLPEGLQPEDMGFEYITGNEREELAAASADFIRREHDAPWCLWANLINPHDICYMAIRDAQLDNQSRWLVEHGKRECDVLDDALRLPPHVSREEFFAEHCPELPVNHEPQEEEPGAIGSLLDRRPFRRNARDHYTDEQWRMHRWAYCRLTERVDRQIGVILEALRATGQEEDTVIVFTSDHGDMDSAHRMEHKTVFYEEAAGVPMIVAQKGTTPGGRVCSSLVSNGLDLIPTLCDYAGVDVPAQLKGMSLRALAEGRSEELPRECIPVESELGRMVVTDRFKYMRFDEGENGEQFMDRVEDPGEMRNAIVDACWGDEVARHRDLFETTFGCTIPEADLDPV